MSNEYSIRVNEVLRGETPVATYDRETGQLDFLPEMARYRVPVVKFLKSENFKIASKPSAKKAEKPKGASAEELYAARKLLEENGQLPADSSGAAVNSTTGQPSLVDYANAGQPLPAGRKMHVVGDPIKMKNYEGQPDKGVLGDKNPVFVDWLYENHPKDAALRYANRVTHRT